jgi:hypothetical protein
MRKIYPIGHWFLTILFAPFVEQAIIYLYTPKPHLVAGLVEVYPITLLFSITFSLPALLLSWVLFYSLTKFDFGYNVSKIIMIGFSILCIAITFAILKMSWDIWVAYIITSILAGLILKIKIHSSVSK